ncbi:MAG: MAPEG family protein [Gloeomargaritaceae cyanobacterium C42_A2020_066]|nr:MAPEG family protein [Gloeomargaritaceae cyanobacterium C42_A2020_066]
MNLPVLPVATPTVLLYGLAMAAGLVYLPYLFVVAGRIQVGPDALSRPRAIVDKLPAYAQRATWAHQNGFEALLLFGIATLMAYVTGQTDPLVAWAVGVHLVGRTLYPLMYLLNWPAGRSLAFGLGMVGTLTLFALSLPTGP